MPLDKFVIVRFNDLGTLLTAQVFIQAKESLHFLRVYTVLFAIHVQHPHLFQIGQTDMQLCISFMNRTVIASGYETVAMQ